MEAPHALFPHVLTQVPSPLPPQKKLILKMPLPHFLNTCGKPCLLESIFHRTFFLSTSWLLHSQFLASVEGTAWLTMLMTSFFIFLIDPVTLHWAYCLKRKFLILNVTPSPTRQLSPKHEILMSTLRNHLEGSGFHIQT